MKLKVEKIINRILNENTYFLHEENSKDGILIDPGFDKDEIEKSLIKNDFVVKHILLTHAHYDHIASAPYFADKYNCDIYISDADNELIKDPAKNVSTYFSKEMVIKNCKTFEKNSLLDFMNFNIKCLPTPGHTIGSTSFYLEDNQILFCGDTILENSFGRTDLYSGNESDIINSIKNIIFTLPDDVILYSGHGNDSSIKIEKSINEIVRLI